MLGMKENFARKNSRMEGGGIGTLLYAAALLFLAWVVHLFTRIRVRRLTRTSAEVAKYLRDFITGAESFWDWDDFTATPIDDPTLDSIRIRARNASATESSVNFLALEQLLDEAERIETPAK